MSFKDVAIVYIKVSAYRIHFWYMSKDDTINIMKNSNLADKKGVAYFFSYLKKKKIKKENMEKTRYPNMSDEKKQRLSKYQKNYR